MIVRLRDSELTHTKKILQDKIEVLLIWLLEFRFTSYSFIQKLLEINFSGTSKLIKKMESENLIVTFTSIHTIGYKYIMLGSMGVKYLQNIGYDTKHAAIRLDRMKKFSTVIHDLSVQFAALKMIKKYKCAEVIWDRNIKTNGERPDLICISEGQKALLEFERWKKKDNRIYQIMYWYSKAIKNKTISAVFYVFESEEDLKIYQKLFEAPQWPRFEKSSQKFKKLPITYQPDDEIRKRFRFFHKDDLGK